MRKSCAAKADSCDGSAKAPVTQCMFGAVSRLGLGLAAAGTGASGASRSGSSLRWASAARSRGMRGLRRRSGAHRGPTWRTAGCRRRARVSILPCFSPLESTFRFTTRRHGVEHRVGHVLYSECTGLHCISYFRGLTAARVCTGQGPRRADGAGPLAVELSSVYGHSGRGPLLPFGLRWNRSAHLKTYLETLEQILERWQPPASSLCLSLTHTHFLFA